MSAERKAAIKWIAFVVAILGTSFTVAMVMLYVSATDPSFAVEPDYYDQALHWDEHAAQRSINEKLGWRVDLQDQPGAAPGARALTVSLTDTEAAPIAGASISVVAFHNARAADQVVFEMEPTGNGIYTALAPLKRAGRWEFRFTVLKGDTTFTEILPVELTPLPAGGFSP